jgi:putative redox protein
MSEAESAGPHIEVFEATATGTGWATGVAINDSEWSFKVDEPTEDGGTNTGPNPMHHFVASLASCQNEQAQVVGEELGIDASNIKITLSVALNLDGFMGVSDNSVDCFQSVNFTARVAGVSDEQASALGNRVDARCPILSLLRSAGVAIQSDWIAG